MTNKRYGTLYIGVTADLIRRCFEHQQGLVGGFTKRYNLDKLVYYEIFEDISEAIKREKILKKYLRFKKLELIDAFNPEWLGLSTELGLTDRDPRFG